MQKMTAMLAVLLGSAALAGCYSKSCDTTCPGTTRMEPVRMAPTPVADTTQTSAPAPKKVKKVKKVPAKPMSPEDAPSPGATTTEAPTN